VAEIRRLHFVGGVSVRELARRTGHVRITIRRALRSVDAPRYVRKPGRSILDRSRRKSDGCCARSRGCLGSASPS
jgi:DeoR/GlpR family transcriptional regulator of sugar metabolism